MRDAPATEGLYPASGHSRVEGDSGMSEPKADVTRLTSAADIRRRRPSRASRSSGSVASKIRAESGRNWAIYVRQSKKRKNQRGEITTISIDLQEQACRKTIAQLDPSPASIDVICDHGRRGVRGHKRPGRDELLSLVDAGEINAVMAFKATRIGRDIEESEHFWNRCQNQGAFVAATDCHDLSNPLVRGVYFGMAQQESVDRSHYSQAAIGQRRSRGVAPVKTGVAYGLRWVGEQLEIDPTEFPIVERIFSLFDDGMSPGAIARQLTAEGVPRRNVSHSQWDRQAVARILRCSWYIGLVPDKDEFWSAGRTFLDAELWNRCAARIEVTNDTKRGLDRPLSGLLYCLECGGWSPMSLCYSRKKRKDGSILQRDRYRCIHRVRDRDFCSGQSIDALEIEKHLLKQIRAVLGGDELAQARLVHRQRQIAEERTDDVNGNEAAISRLRDAQRELFDCRQRGEVIPDFLYNEQMARLDAECREHERARDRALATTSLHAGALKRLQKDLGNGPLDEEHWFDLVPERRNEFLRLLFPHGVGVIKGSSGKKLIVAHRLRPRTAEDVNAAEKLRHAPVPTMKSTGASKAKASAQRRPKRSSSKSRSRSSASARTASMTAASRTSG